MERDGVIQQLCIRCFRAPSGGGGGEASVSDCLPLAAPIGLSPLPILTLCGPERVLVVSTEPPDDLSCLTTPVWGGGGGLWFGGVEFNCEELREIAKHCEIGGKNCGPQPPPPAPSPTPPKASRRQCGLSAVWRMVRRFWVPAAKCCALRVLRSCGQLEW